MIATETIVMRKLKIQTESKQTKTESTTQCNFGQQLVPRFAVDRNLNSADNLKVKFLEPGCHKRRPAGLLESQKVKRQKIDWSVSQQCSTILKKLTTNPSAWPFNQPVDPEKLNIPDYFSIISEPMDLGTIKTKLEKNLYSSAAEFASDVKLTFSNAMLYNPPDNYVHLMAKDLDNMFNSGWKCLEAKWNCKSKRDEQSSMSSERPKNIDVSGQNRCFLSRKDEQASVSSGRPKNIVVSGQNNHKTPSLRVSLQPNTLTSAMKKQKLTEELVRVLKGNMPQQLESFLKKYGFICQKEEKIEVEIDTLDDKTLCELERVIRSSLDIRAELERVIRSSLDIRAAKVEPTKMKDNGRPQSSGKMFHKGMKWQNTISVTGTGSASGSANSKPSLALSKCACGSVRCQCGRQNDFVCSSSSDLSSEKSLEQDDHDACRTDCKVQMASSQMSKSDSDGAASALDEENFCSSPQLLTLATTAASGEACTPLIDVQLSPKKALRHAMLKSRFSDTILRAEQKILLNDGGKADVLKMQQDKEKMERMQHEEMLRIQAEIKAAEAASRLRAEAELKMQREREREAARLALEKVEKSVEIDENLKIFKDLEMLCGCSPFGRFCNALEQLGLYIKEEYLVGENEDIYS
ncbi:transcription factor GTE12-like [Cornus florida]|uniref:transcription factor GTE12-like n=1 Tax=Cornus florida TaxID=4283 RepID=UPI0028984564|nr:transcription factor GTE12-like [Cornus florida]XP_059666478.1 transcription factor GTE12-like [Cornus florida]